jgi:hypothetical protein
MNPLKPSCGINANNSVAHVLVRAQIIYIMRVLVICAQFFFLKVMMGININIEKSL